MPQPSYSMVCFDAGTSKFSLEHTLNHFRGKAHGSERLCCTVLYENVPSVAANSSSFSPKVSLPIKVVRVELDALALTTLLFLSVFR
jgi:hypothetical protein